MKLAISKNVLKNSNYWKTLRAVRKNNFSTTVSVNGHVGSRRAKLGQIQGGVERAIQDSTKGGGVAIIFYFLRVKNRTF